MNKRDTEILFRDILFCIIQQGEMDGEEGVRTFFQDNGVEDFINCRGEEGYTPLIQAVFSHDHTEVAEFLISNGANVDSVSDFGETALSVAIGNKNVAHVRLLVNHGADVQGTIAGSHPHLWKCGKHGLLEIARILLRAGADVNQAYVRNNGTPFETPLWVAAKNGHYDLVKLFLQFGADKTLFDSSGHSPIGVAHHYGHGDVVYLLLRSSPNIWTKLKKIWWHSMVAK